MAVEVVNSAVNSIFVQERYDEDMFDALSMRTALDEREEIGQ